MTRRLYRTTLFLLAILLLPRLALADDLTSHQELAKGILKELVEIDTSIADGNITTAAEAMATRLRDAGLAEADIFVGGPVAHKGNLVARIRGTGEMPPLLLLAHLDVVNADPKDWIKHPFEFIEEDGWYYGRGTSDDKHMAAMWVANAIRYLEEGFIPNRDLIIALTADEEVGPHNGVVWLLENHRDLIEASFALNEGGGGSIRDGVYVSNAIQAAEKVYQSYRLSVRNPGGHSSMPRSDNAIYALADALLKVQAYKFPFELNDVTREVFRMSAEGVEGPYGDDLRAILQGPPDADAVARLSQNTGFNAVTHTTVVATQLDAGHAENALPQSAEATLNARIMPGTSAQAVHERLIEIIDNPEVEVSLIGTAVTSDPSPLSPEIMDAMTRITEEMFPGAKVIPTMLMAFTDGKYLRNAGIPTYGVSGVFNGSEPTGIHGQDERIRAKSFFEGQEFLYKLVKSLAE